MRNPFTPFLKLSIGVFLLANLVTPAAQASEEALWDAERQLQVYFAPAHGLTLNDQLHFEQAQAAIMEQDYQRARQHLEDLRERYPDFLAAQLKLAECYLLDSNPDEAQQLLENLNNRLLAEEERSTSHHTLLWQVRRLLAQSWILQNEPEKAVAVLSQPDLDIHQLSLKEREKYHLLLAKAYESSNQMLLVHAELQKILAFHPISGEARHTLQRLAEPIAKAYYHQGLEAFRERQFSAAMSLGQKAYELVPKRQAYLELYLHAHARFQEEVKLRFEKVRPLLTQELKKIRGALEVGDLERAQNLYTALQNHPEVAYFLQAEQRSILPQLIQQNLNTVLNTLEKVLQSRNSAQ